MLCVVLSQSTIAFVVEMMFILFLLCAVATANARFLHRCDDLTHLRQHQGSEGQNDCDYGQDYNYGGNCCHENAPVERKSFQKLYRVLQPHEPLYGKIGKNQKQGQQKLRNHRKGQQHFPEQQYDDYDEHNQQQNHQQSLQKGQRQRKQQRQQQRQQINDDWQCSSEDNHIHYYNPVHDQSKQNLVGQQQWLELGEQAGKQQEQSQYDDEWEYYYGDFDIYNDDTEQAQQEGQQQWVYYYDM